MFLTRYAISRPAVIAVAVALTALFGLLSIKTLPIQLFPDITRPSLSLTVHWRAAAAEEMESEVAEPLEQVLQGISGTQTVYTEAGNGRAEIDLEFEIGTDMEKAMLEVISRVNQATNLPSDIDGPFIHSGSNNDQLTSLFLQQLPGNDTPIQAYQDLVEAQIEPALTSVDGVSRIEVRGESDRQVEIRFDPYRLAELGITIPELVGRISAGRDASAGRLDIGRKEYKLRYAGRYELDEFGDMVVAWRGGLPVYLRDLADVEVQRAVPRTLRVQNGNPAINISVMKESGANALESLLSVKEAIEQLNSNVLARNGVHLEMSYDASVFIMRALNMVTGNLLFGVLLAVAVLWCFIRKARATLIIAMSIPISILLTICVLKLTGRTLNVISLAGLAFAVGMVLDAAIVVLENIIRLREKRSALAATQQADNQAVSDKSQLNNLGDLAEQGTKQVWSALLASTLTTVAIFLPILMLNDVEGQLFADLAITIAVAVTMSLIVAVTVLPVAASRWLADSRLQDNYTSAWQRLAGLSMRLTATPLRRSIVIVTLLALPLALTRVGLPKMDYLPDVKRDAVDVWFSIAPGIGINAVGEEVMDTMVERLQPYMDGEKEPALKNYYFIMWPGGATMGVRAIDQTRIKELEAIVRDEITVGLPDVRAFARQGSLFGSFGSGKEILVVLKANDMPQLFRAAKEAKVILEEAMPNAQVWPHGSLEFTAPELRLIPNDRRLAEVGWSRGDLPTVIRALGSGRYLGNFFDGNQQLDMMLMTSAAQSPEQLGAIPLATPSGAIVPLGELLRVDTVMGPKSIDRIDGKRAFVLAVQPSDDMTLEVAMEQLQAQAIEKIEAVLPEGGSVQLSGNADSLKQAINNMLAIFAFALSILLLLLWGLFGTLRDALLVILTLPLATSGGVMAIQIMHTLVDQPVDLLTMIGFVILLGLVVNNAILLVHQTRTNEREGMERVAAVQDALTRRIRPIFMTTLTSVCGMLPLLLSPATGSEIYRGLASVIVGGMLVSTLFTLILLPALLRMGKAASSTDDHRTATSPKRVAAQG
ncbi:efflux RND transporter permease subunit [Photobacterium aphoticum]|uniref:Acriflavine resistance protein B n=1 Tax=Photobacterium aphoticum TaxID=754436 RepID=A0A0J1GGA9_9GAMM|nr:efflux RND transporter permease subunit [Photobacterium aphoticum]KLU98724.1 acriflavine resistance protein B [Photobacterium aphoticum]PSU55998.1 AcrB/AcrD/AcrF family protein [Photobacterium aphoticum]GHA51734.1 acriflavine resistance protein B [Photobacterium aphoticum]